MIRKATSLGTLFVGLVFGFAVVIANAALTQAQSACDATTNAALGLTDNTIDSAGGERRYLLYVPESYDPAQPTPLILSLHGFASNPEQQMEFSQWNAAADEYNLIVAYPQGTGFPLGWNAGELPGILGILVQRPDDVSFIRDLIDGLNAQLCIDPVRVYVNGLSNGGGMSNRIACELADTVAAIGSVVGAYNPLETCEPSRPIPVIAVHGDADPVVPYEGGETQGGALPAIQTWAAEWGVRNGCDATPTIDEDVVRSQQIYGNCAEGVEVVLYTIFGGGHTWAGGGDHPPESIVGAVIAEFPTTDIMWTFFEAHPLNG
ncbi:MAG: PHB depolymerase family esterase [Chloroflexota bacterium]|nr:PHB depolymerase family esterase [Chloroflexota bacterium]